MPLFQYEAIDSKSEVTTGSIEAANKADATQQLRANGLFPKQIVEQGKGKLKATKGKKMRSRRSKTRGAPRRGKIKGKVLMIFTRQLATLIDSGLP